MRMIRPLLAGIVDYAGLFPPASLAMSKAASNYALYRNGTHAWMLGRFVLPVSRLTEFAFAVQQMPVESETSTPWKLSVLVGVDWLGEMRIVEEFNRKMTFAKIDAVETRASKAEEISRFQQGVTAGMEVYIEVPVDSDPELLAAIASAGVRAKVRTGGRTAEVFPTTANLVRFIQRCVTAGVRFKATAGLHHPMRSSYRLTYAPNSPSGPMFGFLNVFLAAAFARQGMSATELALVLEEQSPEAFQFDGNTILWRGHLLEQQDIEMARATVATSFGSCSFREPVDELTSLGML